MVDMYCFVLTMLCNSHPSALYLFGIEEWDSFWMCIVLGTEVSTISCKNPLSPIRSHTNFSEPILWWCPLSLRFIFYVKKQLEWSMITVSSELWKYLFNIDVCLVFIFFRSGLDSWKMKHIGMPLVPFWRNFRVSTI